MICETHLHFLYFSLVTLSQLVTPCLAAFVPYAPYVCLRMGDVCCPAGHCFVTMVKVQVVPNTVGRREYRYWRVSWLIAKSGASLFQEINLVY